MTTVIEAARTRWLHDRPRYADLGRVIEARMGAAVRDLGVWCDTTSRAKETHSLVKKLLRKPEHTYESLSDKVGVRCVIRYRDDLARVVAVAQGLFDCGRVDSKADSLGVDQIGYLSVHIDVALREGNEADEQFRGMRAELQIRTLAQHLWSEMSHDAVYKNEAIFADLPDELRRRINLMAGVIEVADMEFNRLNSELAEAPVVQLYKELEKHYFKFTARNPDPALSLDIIALLMPLFAGASVPSIAARVDHYVSANESNLHQIYSLQQEHETSDLVFQPEALLIGELLERDQQSALRKRWSERFPDRELERLAVVFGHSFD